MQPLSTFQAEARRDIRGIFADIDETITTDGRITSDALAAMERVRQAGLMMIPVTGRPAGWCDHIARMWPVDAVVGENGAFFFRHDPDRNVMVRRYVLTRDQRRDNWDRYESILTQIIKEVDGAKVAADQAYREADLAIDYCEDVENLCPDAVAKIVDIMESHGMVAKVSSIHVNGWFGEYDNLSVIHIMMRDVFMFDLVRDKKHFAFIGDSPNDVPMFDFFPHSIGVANVRAFEDKLDAKPAYVTEAAAGQGFAEAVDYILAAMGKP